jgi:hypothetical protein
MSDWVKWPELLFSWHFAVIVLGTLALALTFVLRRPEALKAAVIVAAYTGLPSLLTLTQALGQIRFATNGPAVAQTVVWGFGMLGQVPVIWSCLARLAPAPQS